MMTEAYANDSATIRFYYDADAHFPVVILIFFKKKEGRSSTFYSNFSLILDLLNVSVVMTMHIASVT